ncbi:CKM [Bugula neritina]|uniref:CKM n=1 Tax=Bugula neritina TaxID=10212 RepID=A0A7J7JF77_BUGNE|nr:CKM [Bugula neritina]
MSEEERKQLIKEHVMFDAIKDTNVFASGVARDWPDARGVFYNEAKDFVVWANVEDHAQVHSAQYGADMQAVFDKLCDGMGKFEAAVKKGGKEFMRNDHLGYIVTRPEKLGTALKAGVSLSIPKLAAHPKVKELMKAMKLEDTKSCEEGRLYVHNKETLGSSEASQVQCLVDGVQNLIKIEKALAAGKDAGSLISQAIFYLVEMLQKAVII